MKFLPATALRTSQSRNPRNSGNIQRRRSKSRQLLNYSVLEPRALLAVVISEFVASNTASFEDGRGSSSDWVELYNNGSTSVDLNGYHLSDDASDPFAWRFNQTVSLAPDSYMVVFASGQNEVDPGGFFHTDFKLSAGGEYIGLFDPAGNVLSEFGAGGTDYPAQQTDISYGTSAGALVDANSPSHYLVPSNGTLGNSWNTVNFNPAANGFTAGVASIGYENSPNSSTSFADLIFNPQLPVGTTSTYLRTEFNVVDASAVSDLTLSLQFDDGFAAYLNGTLVESRHAGNGLAWNATASAIGDENSALTFVDFNLNDNVGLLQDGKNVLAIHALNRSNSSDYLLVPRLTSSSVVGQTGYLASPTPLAANDSVITLGPTIEDVTASGIEVGANQSLVLTARVTAASVPLDTSSVEITYRRGFTNEVTLTANDSGFGGDAVAGDGVFSVTVPNVGAAGGLLRWYVTAEDTSGNSTRAPRFNDPLNSAEYFGTVVTDASVDTDLPVLYWFVQNESGASTDSGARGSLFLNGEFYDNIDTNAHGQSTRGSDFPKKSFDFDANSGDKFRIRDDIGRVSDFNLLTNYADQTKVRHPLAYDIYDEAGHPASLLGFSVTVYRNGEFYGLYDIIEEGDEEFLEREGLDTDGALYKVNNRLNSAYNEVDKKSREYENHDDFQVIIDDLAAANTASAELDLIYDHIDVATLINYVAINALIGNADYGNKNMYWYRDTEGTGQWQNLPWDQDLSFGHQWNGSLPSSPYFDNVLVTNISLDHSLNDFFRRVVSDPDLRDMYHRRLRTLTDQFYGAAGTSGEDSWVGQRARELEALNSDEAAADLQRWGQHFRYGASYPFNPGQAVDQLVNEFIPLRRNYILGDNDVPSAQIGSPAIVFDAVDFDANPVSGLQAEEYIRLNNPTSAAVDLSGWELTGGISHTFLAGTVVPSGGSLYVVKDVKAFMARSTGPSAGQKLVIQGNYNGQLASTGESVDLVDQNNSVIDTLVTPDEGNSNNQQFLQITEINYNPVGGNSEFIEFHNNSNLSTPTTLDLTGVAITEGLATPYVFPAGTTLGAGQYLVVVQDAAGFAAKYPTVSSARVAGVYSGTLSNSGDTLRVEEAGGEKILEFAFSDNDPWSPVADGAGGTLELVDAATPEDLLGKYYSWQGSARTGGTPAAASLTLNSAVRINEVLSHTDLPQRDFIELQNTTSSPVNIGGWYLSDSKNELRQFQIPAGTVIAANGFLVFDESDFNAAPGTQGNFALSSSGESVWLTAPINTTESTFVDMVQFGATYNGESFGIDPRSDGRFVPQTSVTAGAANSAARVGPVVISEVNYHPGNTPVGKDPRDFEFIEIHNTSSASSDAISLTDWELRGEADFDFPAISIAGGQTLVVVRFDPNDAANATLLSDFRSHYGINNSVTLLGGFSGSLSNSWGRVELQSPDVPPAGDPAAIEHVTADEFVYDDRAPWPTAADGGGSSLTRVGGDAVANDAENWVATSPTPGQANLLVAGVQGRYVFYNNSSFDGNVPAANASDDLAISSKTALLPGQVATFANYTSYAKGINGLFVDLGNLGTTPLSASDFSFSTGNSGSASAFQPLGIDPDITVRPGAGVNGSDRVSLIFPDGSVTTTWLQVTVKANATTGLSSDDVFYFGNVIGETGGSSGNAIVNLTDVSLVRINQSSFSSVGINSLYDFDRNGRVNLLDIAVARTNQSGFSAVQLITAPSAGSTSKTFSVASLNASVASVATSSKSLSSSDEVRSVSFALPVDEEAEGFDEIVLTSTAEIEIASIEEIEFTASETEVAERDAIFSIPDFFEPSDFDADEDDKRSLVDVARQRWAMHEDLLN